MDRTIYMIANVKKFIVLTVRKLVRFVETLTNTEITIHRRPRVWIKVHPQAVNDGRAMSLYVRFVENFCNFKPANIFEIGANYGQDAEYLRKSFGLKAGDVYVFEPHPQILAAVRKLYGFNCFEVAASNVSGRSVFHAIDVDNNEYRNSGISSLKNGLTTDKKNFIDIDVEVTRMDEFVEQHQIAQIDFLKLDVEGANYEVLEGFGQALKKVKAIQVEGEYKQYWEGQKLYWDIEELLRRNDFELVHFTLSPDAVQSDSFWVQTQYLARA